MVHIKKKKSVEKEIPTLDPLLQTLLQLASQIFALLSRKSPTNPFSRCCFQFVSLHSNQTFPPSLFLSRSLVTFILLNPVTYQYYLTLEILSYLWIPLSILVLAKFHWLLLLSLLWTFALFSLASKHWTQFLDPFSSLHTTSAWKLIWFCGFKYSTGLGISVFYVYFSPLSWIFRCLYPNCLLESLLGSQSCILNLDAQGWTRNFTLQFSVFISGFPSNPHAAFPISGQKHWQ